MNRSMCEMYMAPGSRPTSDDEKEGGSEPQPGEDRAGDQAAGEKSDGSTIRTAENDVSSKHNVSLIHICLYDLYYCSV